MLARRFPSQIGLLLLVNTEHCILFSSATSQKHQFGINFKFSLSSTHGFHFKFNFQIQFFSIHISHSLFSVSLKPLSSFSASHQGKEHDRFNNKLE
jgi:hypothetical protein